MLTARILFPRKVISRMNNQNAGVLGRILSTRGGDALKRAFYNTATEDRGRAAELINDEKTPYPVLWMLLPEIDALKLESLLSPRNKIACDVTRRKLGKTYGKTLLTPEARSEEDYNALRWMFDTGKDWSPRGVRLEMFDAVIDYVAALLAEKYDDVDVQVETAHLVFRRHRAGRNIHDLVWALYRSVAPAVLRAIAEYLLSRDREDVELASQLLPGGGEAPQNAHEAQERYEAVSRWIEENGPYLYITGEYFQQTSAPAFVDFDDEAKYLDKPVSPKDRTPLVPLTDDEYALLAQFRALPGEERSLLASYSYALRQRDREAWNQWRTLSAAQQVMAARQGFEVI
jgi:hypothetical protein